MKSPSTATKPKRAAKKAAKPKQAAKRPQTPRKLNVRQERFAELVASGMPATKAYSEAGYSNDPRIAEAHACRLVENGGVKARIAQLRAPQTRKTLMSRDRKREILAGIAESEASGKMAIIRAIEVDAKLAGHFEPDRTEIDVGPRTLQSIAERAASIKSAMVRKYTGK